MCTVSFAETGTVQYWTVPTGVTSATITAAGGSGGAAFGTTAVGGAGGRVRATVALVPSAGLQLVVGGAGSTGSPPASGAPAAGGYGGGGVAGVSGNTVAQAGGGGGGGTFVFESSRAAPLLVAGGGGGAAGGLAYANSTGGAGGAGTDAANSDLGSDPLSGSGARVGSPGAGGTVPPADLAGQDGSGPATGTSNLGVGGSGATNKSQIDEGTAGGGGGGYWGGGGGGSDTGGKYDGTGGGGSGYVASGGTILDQMTNVGNGLLTITYTGVQTTTSGVLRDAVTAAAIPNSCVVFSPVGAPGETNYTSVGGDGSWSFTSTDRGPFNLAFYVTSSGDCSQPILSTPVPSWYVNKPLTGTDEHVIIPPKGAASVAAGTSDVIACLGATALPTACAIPKSVLSGTAVTTNNTPLADVCVFALTHNGAIAVTLTDTAGRWSLAGLVPSFSVVVGFVPNFSSKTDPCDSGNGPPPAPRAGALQPVFYDDIWLNLADPTLLNDPLSWALRRGATLITKPTTGINACLTAAPGNITPRPSCAPATTAPTTSSTAPTLTTSNGHTLADTGTPLTALLSSAAVGILIGALLLRLAIRRRPV